MVQGSGFSVDSRKLAVRGGAPKTADVGIGIPIVAVFQHAEKRNCFRHKHLWSFDIGTLDPDA